MKDMRSHLLLVFLSASVLSGAMLVSRTDAIIVDRIVAVVNGQVITLSELERRAQPILNRYISDDLPPEERSRMKQQIYAKILPQMIDDYLVKEEVDRLSISVSDQEAETAIENICRENGFTRQEFEQRLAEDGITIEEYKKQIIQQIERARLINAQVRSKIVVTDEQVREYIEKQNGPMEYEGPFYTLDHICIVPTSNSASAKMQAKQKALQALEALKRGEPFQQVAEQYAKTGAEGIRLGVFTLDEMAPVIRKAVERLSPGAYSDVIETSMGFQIFKLVQISRSKERKIDPLEMEEVRRKLYNQQIDERFQEWLNGLRSKSTIRILL